MTGWLGRLFGFGKKEELNKQADRRDKKSTSEKSQKAAKTGKNKKQELPSSAAGSAGDGRVPPKVRSPQRKSKAPAEMTEGSTVAPASKETSVSEIAASAKAEDGLSDVPEVAGTVASAVPDGIDGIDGADTGEVGVPGHASEKFDADGASDAAPAKPEVSLSGDEPSAHDKRVLLQQGVNGEYVRRVQSVLVSEGFDLGAVDGVFGRLTLDALKRLQKKLGLKTDGVVNFGLWRDVTKQPVPGIFERCLQITSSFEGHGFTKIAGNFDNAGVTWGTIGYNIRSRSLQPIMDYFIDYRPDLVREAFGPLAEELVRVMEAPLEEQMTWGDQISIGTQKHRIAREWAQAFARFGEMDEVQEMQLNEAREKYWALAERDRQRFDLTSELGAALAFDIAVQCGGIDGGDDTGPEQREIERRFEVEKPKRERDRRVIIADVVAHHSHPRYVFDVLSRKMTLATGEGTVHGKPYTADHWGLGDYPLSDA